MIFGSRFFYCIVGFGLLLFVVGLLSTFYVSATSVGQVRLWQKTEETLIIQPATMKPGNRWDAEFDVGMGEQLTEGLDISGIFELVGVVNSDEPHALIRLKDPKDARVGEVISVTLGADLSGGVKMTDMEESRITLKLLDEETVFVLYESSERENEQTMEKRVDIQP